VNRLVAVVGPTATGKSALGIALARRVGGEVLACDSTAVYRGIDIGTDKMPVALQGGVPHHLVDLVAPTETYSAARYGTEAAAVAREVVGRGHVPILVGGTGFYYRALIRGIFPGPTRDDGIRTRLDRVAARKGPEALHRWLGRVDEASARRIQPRDRMRLVRALEVYLLTRKPLTDHFAQTRSPIAEFQVLTIGLRLPRPTLLERVTARVDEQFRSGLVLEVDRLLANGVPADAHAFSGLVYRQIMEMRAGLRDLAATRDLIIRENMRYARRQLMWFRREANVQWIDAAGETGAAQALAQQIVDAWMARAGAGAGDEGSTG
jgi:tRNA dimethylallyltransferase